MLLPLKQLLNVKECITKEQIMIINELIQKKLKEETKKIYQIGEIKRKQTVK